MKKIYFLLFLVFFLSMAPVKAQKKVVVVQPDAGLNVGALNNAIKSEADPGNTIFELKRGGLYLLNGAISHTGYTLHIRAESGNGLRPVLQPAVDALGASGNHFTSGGGLILEGLFIQGRNELGAIGNRQFDLSGNENRIIINDCFFDYSNQVFLRFSSSNNKVYITNSVFRNSIRPENPNNGRIIDLRGNPQDTIIIENSTIHNCIAELIRADNGFIKYYRFNHNTLFQCCIGGYKLNLNKIFKADVTNNLFYNFSIRGDLHSHDAFFNLDSIFTVGTYKDADRYFKLNNNNFYTQKEFGDTLEKYCPPKILYRFIPTDLNHKDTIWYKFGVKTYVFANKTILDTAVVTPPPTLINFIKAGQVDTTNVFSEKLEFKNPPPLGMNYWKFLVQTGFNPGSNTPPKDAYIDEDPVVLGDVSTGAYDFSYRSYAKSASAATGGKPLGASKWVPYTVVSAEEIKADLVNKVTTYPNPATGSITFKISAVEPGSVKVVICDLLGKQLNVTEKQLISGNNQVLVNLESISKPGIYLYQVQIGDPARKSVLSGKLIKK